MSSSNGYTNGIHEKGMDELLSHEYAESCDQKDPLRHLRDEFIIPSRADLKRKTLEGQIQQQELSEPSTYLCGNSLGVQPRKVEEYVAAQLHRWRTKGVYGHFQHVKGSILPPWLDLDEAAAEQSSRIVGAQPSEVAVMQTLTANLHFLMASFYRPNKDRYKIILEGKAFPSDHYVVESQIRHHDLSPSDAMVLIEPPADTFPLIETSHILSVIDAHAASTALLLLPGIQFYTCLLLDMKTITAHAQSKGIIVGWDLAHAVGNVPLHLHDWNADFAAWCNYKYMNCGPGAMGGLFVHSRHTDTDDTTTTTTPNTQNGTPSNGTATTAKAKEAPSYRPRLAGWWGSSKATRFAMTNEFIPIPGAGGFQVSNPSAIDHAAVLGSLSVFAQTDMPALRTKSLALTAYLEKLLDRGGSGTLPWKIITPRDPAQRGAQISVQLEPGLLDAVMEELEEQGVVLDERKPDVVRVAPAPLYNSFQDVRRFAVVFYKAVDMAVEAKKKKARS